MTGDFEDALRVEGLDAPLRVKVNGRARRLILRSDPATGEIVLVLPSRSHRKRGLAFAEANAAWIARQIHRSTPAVPFTDGSVVPILGEAHRIRHTPTLRSILAVEEGEIRVAGPRDGVPRRISRWMRVEAQRLLARKTHDAASALRVVPAAITIRDTKSRWGSCSAAGRLSFSWRLFLAPEAVGDYVVAHEVAHLRELNHGPAFWRLVAELCPDYRDRRRWLKEHGQSLHRYG